VRGALRRGNLGGRVMALTWCLQGMELGGRAVGFGGGTVELRRCGRRAMTGGAHQSARRGEGHRQLSLGALSYSGGEYQAGHWRST
jgi:hypothetical protein